MRHIIPVSGKDSCATMLVQMACEPQHEYELFFSDVGTELPETYAWLEKVEERSDRKIHRVGKSLVDMIRHKAMLPSHRMRFCTREAKIQPMEKWIGKEEATIYFGLRADEDRVGYQNQGRWNITPRYPLAEMGIGIREVYLLLDKQDLQPPKFFWQRLYDAVLDEMNCPEGFGRMRPVENYLDSLPRWVFEPLFSWRSRSNCFFCFYQRKYEWLGLLEHHPELFATAEELEESIGGADRREEPFRWMGDAMSLGELRVNQQEMFAHRVKQVVHMLRTKRLTLQADELTVVSCGFFCGK